MRKMHCSDHQKELNNNDNTLEKLVQEICTAFIFLLDLIIFKTCTICLNAGQSRSLVNVNVCQCFTKIVTQSNKYIIHKSKKKL